MSVSTNLETLPYGLGVLGILGAGQLGLMLGLAALKQGVRCVFLDDAPNPPAALIGQVYATSQLEEFLQHVDKVTFEFENTPLKSAQHIARQMPFYPPASVLESAQDRAKEKALLSQLGIQTAPYRIVQDEATFWQAVDAFTAQCVVKTTLGGYDGKGQAVVHNQADAEDAWQLLGQRAPLIVEGFVDFLCEGSIIGVRGTCGTIKLYPCAQNVHRDGVLHTSRVPAPNLSDVHVTAAQNAMRKLMQHFDYVGVLALEFFVTSSGIIANEIAPRVHNSGHWSQNGAACDQFENHIRAVMGLPLGDTHALAPTVMLNILGEYPEAGTVLGDSAHLHHYHKAPRPGRKIGHLNLVNATDEDISQTKRLLGL